MVQTRQRACAWPIRTSAQGVVPDRAFARCWTPMPCQKHTPSVALLNRGPVRAPAVARLSVRQNATAAAIEVDAATALPHPNRGASDPSTVTLAPAADDNQQGRGFCRLRRSLRHAKRQSAVRKVRRRVMVHLHIHLDVRASCNDGLEQIAPLVLSPKLSGAPAPNRATPPDDRIAGERSSRRPRAGDAFATISIVGASPAARSLRSIRASARAPCQPADAGSAA